MIEMRRFHSLASATLFGLVPWSITQAQDLPKAAQLEKEFANPPMEYRPLTRYWWFGGAVTRQELARELKGMKEQGLAGVEIQSVYDALPAVADHKPVLYASPEWADRVAMCVEEAAKLGMKVDLTPGSGWPYAGPWVDNEHAGQMLESQTISVEGPSKWTESFQTRGPVIAVTMRRSHKEPAQVVTNWQNGFAVPEGKWLATCFWAKLDGVGQHKRANPRDKGPVLDHLSAQAMDLHLNYCVKPVLDRVSKFAGSTFEALFIDSWELGKPTWTTDFLEQFRKRRGYDLTPYLHLLNGSGDGISSQVQWDYEQTLRDLIVDNCYGELTHWSHQHGLQSRAQTHGSPSDWEDSYGAADIPEFEMDFKVPSQDLSVGADLARAAANVYGRPIVSCESFTWLTEHWRATMHDLRQQADAIFACGANQLVFHGYSYSPPETGFPGWNFYASCEINHNNPFWPYFRVLSDYLSRNCLLLRSGRPVADVCVYGAVSFPGWSRDRVTDRTIDRAGCYRALILDASVLPLETMEKVRALVEDGLTVIAVRLPEEVPTFKEHDAQTARLHEIVARLFPKKTGPASPKIGKGSTYVTNEQSIPAILRRVDIEPELTAYDLAEIRWLHRQGADYDMFLLHNPSSENSVHQWFSFRAKGCLEIWNPHNGKCEQVPYRVKAGRVVAQFEIGARESRLVMIRRDKPAFVFDLPVQEVTPILDVAGPWSATFQHVDGRKPFERSFAKLIDWTEIADLKYFSGTATYLTQFSLARAPQGKVFLDLGKVCDEASVTINGKPAGTVFESPFRVEVTGLVRAGKNELLVSVANRAENAIGDAATSWKGPGKWPGYFFVNRNYEEYDPTQAQIHPSGLLGPVKLRAN